MARSKQTARKSCGGAAPRAQTVTAKSRSFRTFMTSAQNLGSSHTGTKRIFINCENTFGGFTFPRTPGVGVSGPITEQFRAVVTPMVLHKSQVTLTPLSTQVQCVCVYCVTFPNQLIPSSPFLTHFSFFPTLTFLLHFLPPSSPSFLFPLWCADTSDLPTYLPAYLPTLWF